MNIVILSVLALFVATPRVQSTSACAEANPHLERLGEAIRSGDLESVRQYLNSHGDVNQTWRDTRFAICQSLLLRSIWYGQEPVFRLLLERGADPARTEGHLRVPIREGHVRIVRTLLARGVQLERHEDVLDAALQSQNVEMLDLILSSGVSVIPSEFPVVYLTNEMTRYLVPKYFGPNAEMFIGTKCQIEKLFGTSAEVTDGCEDARGPLWLHFVMIGNYEMVAFMITHGADLSLRGAAARPFTAIMVARARKDSRMIRLLQSGKRTP